MISINYPIILKYYLVLIQKIKSKWEFGGAVSGDSGKNQLYHLNHFFIIIRTAFFYLWRAFF